MNQRLKNCFIGKLKRALPELVGRALACHSFDRLTESSTVIAAATRSLE